MDALAAPPPPQGKYRPAVAYGSLGFSAGMTPRLNGELTVRGVVGVDVSTTAARDAAGVAARNALSAIARAAGGLYRVQGWLTMTVYIAAIDGFQDHSAVADGASDALDALLPGGGGGARTAIGVSSLPSGAPVEVALTAALGPATTGRD